MSSTLEKTSPTVQLTAELIRRPSITPKDEGCQDLLAGQLEKLGFSIERLHFDDTENFWARLGNQGPVFAFVGHTDVVPPGPIEKWQSSPFAPTIRDGILYGRGSADMKGGIAAMLMAIDRFLKTNKKIDGSIALLITSDEEGTGANGTKRVIQHLQSRGEKIEWCIVGEASAAKKIGDTIKNGRRGSLIGKLIVHGLQGHIAYPHLAENPIHSFAGALSDLCNEQWDKGNEFFQPTTFQISNINAGTGADNVIPGHLEVLFGFRFSTESTPEDLQNRVKKILDKYKLKYDLNWRLSGSPFLTPKGKLLEVACSAIKEITGITAEVSTTGGTSDGRFIAPTGAQVLEIGVVNASIHKVDEHVKISDLDTLSDIYQRILEKLLLPGN
jgi:succinyl-diaminopimelate desuccinylase